MEFGRVPDKAKEARPWADAVMIGPPPGMADQVGSVEALVDDKTAIGRGFRMYVQPSAEEREAIYDGAPIEFVVYSHQLVPVSAAVLD